MNDAQLARLLQTQNPWWREAHWQPADADFRRAEDAVIAYRPDPLSGIAPPGLYVLRGPRRVGKSLELKRAIERLISQGIAPRQVIFCACDGLRAQDLRRLFHVGRNLTRSVEGPRYWFLDEVTAVAGGWPAIVKHARDQGPVADDCLVLTGSSARDLHEARKDLAGRRGGVATAERLLLPMGFREFCSALRLQGPADLPRLRPDHFLRDDARDAILELTYWQDELQQLWDLYLDVGGFPRAVDAFRRTSDVGDEFVRDLWEVISGEALRRSTMSDVEIRTLLQRLSTSLASPLNLTTIARELGLSHHTVSSRVDDLTVSFLMWVCHQARGDVPNLAAQRKAYFLDPLLAGIVHRLDPSLPAPDHSVLSEQQLGSTLLRALDDDQTGALVDGGRLMYERTPTGNEIDFVGPRLGVPFEAKYVDEGWRREVRTLVARHGRGVVATRGALDVDGDVWAVPVSMVAWLSAQ